MRQFPQFIRVQDVVANGTHFRVSNMFQLVRRGNIPQCPYAWRSGLPIFIHLDAIPNHVDASLVKIHEIAIGNPSGSNQHDLAVNCGTVRQRGGNT